MAQFSARHATYPPVAELVAFIAVQGGLVATDGTDETYESLKLLVREQKGKDLLSLEPILDELQARFVEEIAPPGLGEIVFLTLRRVLDRYKSLVLSARVIAWTRDEFLEKELIPKFVVPHVGWLLGQLDREPIQFFDLDAVLRADAPLNHAFERCFQITADPPKTLASLYEGKARSYRGQAPDHDVEDKRKIVRRWKAGIHTPSLETCFQLLDGLGLAEYSGVTLWVWIARLLQKVPQQYRHLIADWIQAPGSGELPKVSALSTDWNRRNDEIARDNGLSSKGVTALRILSTLLFYNTHRYKGDKARVEEWLEVAKDLVADAPSAKYYLTWLTARYHLYCRDTKLALACYEQAMEEGMYGDFQVETALLPEWAAVAQKVGAKPALKRINSRLMFLRLLPTRVDLTSLAETRIKFFHENLGAGRCFVESFVTD